MSDDNQAIFMKGDISDGYIPYGPYKSRDEAADIHDCEDGWVMTLNNVRVPTQGEREEMHDHSLDEANSIPTKEILIMITIHDVAAYFQKIGWAVEKIGSDNVVIRGSDDNWYQIKLGDNKLSLFALGVADEELSGEASRMLREAVVDILADNLLNTNGGAEVDLLTEGADTIRRHVADYNKGIEQSDRVPMEVALDVYCKNRYYKTLMPAGVDFITRETDPDVVYNFRPYMTLEDFTQPPSRVWQTKEHDNQLCSDGSGIEGYFEYEGGWTIELAIDGKFQLSIEDHHGKYIDFGKSYNLRELEIKLHAYESLRAANRVW